MSHGSAHIYLDQERVVDMKGIDNTLDKIAYGSGIQKITGKITDFLYKLIGKKPEVANEEVN